LTADKVCKIWALRVSRIIVVFETSEPCRKPAPFGKGRARMPDVERPKALHGRKANRAFISQELVLGGACCFFFECEPWKEPKIVKPYAETLPHCHWRVQDLINSMTGAGLSVREMEEL
jgi:hypothetical protein